MAPATRGFGENEMNMPREGSWQIPEADTADEQAASESDNDPFEEPQDMRMDSPTPKLRNSSRDPLPALQKTAERVSRQVEAFAKDLDQYCSRKIDPTKDTAWQLARQLVMQYQETVEKRINNVNERSGYNKLKRKASFSREEETELESCQFEADTWEIFYRLLELKDPEARASLKREQKTALEGLHRYSSDDEVWEAFIRSDGFAQECLTILTWLQRNAAKSRPPIQDLIEKEINQTQRGDGVWPAGWLYAKLAIKNAKRMRSWPRPLDPDAPGLQASLKSNADSDPVVSQLDPDAATRQHNSLFPEDVHHEKASWWACWEMLRRGTPYGEVEDWWQERKESWRAASILGAGLRHDTNPMDTGVSWMISLPRKLRNRAMSILSGADMKLDEHEAAVYGLLCSQTQPSLAVCSSIDDLLFVYFSNLLLNSYHRFCDMYHEKAFAGKRVSFQPTTPQYDLIDNIVTNSLHQSTTDQESRSPSKAIQAAIVSDRYNQLLVRVGKALSYLARRDGDWSLVYVSDAVVDETAIAVAQDRDALRVVAHLYILLKSLRLADFSGSDEQYAQNCIAGYVGVLREESKMEMIPLYISHLSSVRRKAQTLGPILIDITDANERDTQVRLLKKYNIELGPVLRVLYSFLVNKETATKEKGFRPIRVVEYAGSGKVRTLRVKAGFLGDELTNEEELLVRCLEWYQYIDHQTWQDCCQIGTLLYLRFILQGRLVAASALATRASLSSISVRVINEDLSLMDSAEVSDEDYEGEPDGYPAQERSKSVSPSKYRKRQANGSTAPNISQMRQQAQTWRELEQLVAMLGSLEEWSFVQQDTEANRDNMKQMIVLKRSLTKALDAVKLSTYPIFSPTYLNQPLNPDEAGPLSAIRKFYLPEIILAYNSVLHFAGHALTRDHLTECMDLATEVATIQELTDVFTEAGRMGEFVQQCAMSAKALLSANEQGGSKPRKKKAGVAGNTDIFQVKSTTKSLQAQIGATKQ